MLWIALTILLFSGTLISYQDLSTRLISLWLIIAFALANAWFYLQSGDAKLLFENLLFCTGYLLLLYLALVLYFFVKYRRFETLTNSHLGWGDILIMLAIGISIDPERMIYFFSAAMLVSLFASLILFRKQRQLPLAGLLVINYLAFVIYGVIWP